MPNRPATRPRTCRHYLSFLLQRHILTSKIPSPLSRSASAPRPASGLCVLCARKRVPQLRDATKSSKSRTLRPPKTAQPRHLSGLRFRTYLLIQNQESPRPRRKALTATSATIPRPNSAWADGSGTTLNVPSAASVVADPNVQLDAVPIRVSQVA